MGLDDTTEPRVVARNITRDDPTWGQVAAFLDAADSAYTDAPSPTQQAVHLAAISQAFHDDAPQRNKTMPDIRSRQRGRTALGALLAAFVVIGGGVTAASAFGGLTLLPTQQEPQQVPAPMLMDSEADLADTDTGEEGDDADDESAASPKPASKMESVETHSSDESESSDPYDPPKQTTTHQEDEGDDDDDASHSDDHDDHEDDEDHEDESDD